MKTKLRITSILLTVLMLSFDFSVTAFAFQNKDEVKFLPTEITELPMDSEMESLSKKFKSMSNSELNAYISELVDQANSKDQSNSLTLESTSPLQAAWLAAAQIAKNAGYPCAGTLVQYSVLGTDYSETNATFSTKIKTTSAYRNWLQNRKNSIEFTKSDNSDLFYAIHYANIMISSSSSQGALIRLTDIFDFKLDTNMGDLFSTLVNDWAWLCQNMNVLKVINVNITINA